MSHISSQEPDSALLLDLLRSKLGTQFSELRFERGHVVARVAREGMLDFFQLLKIDTQLDFNMLLSVTVVDWMDQAEERFEVVYHLLSIPNRYRLRVKIWAPETSPEVESLCSLWSSANFMEREAWDMYGVVFRNHPDLRRILTYDEFKGYPLRKDYPVQGKQPRVKMLHPEVQNTARSMIRPDLVQIRSRSETQTPAVNEQDVEKGGAA
ncbi:MAG: NADH-quinone oxidoreductase subunit C [Bdellovibrionales bacterium]|nr:NADH-quinone oxidoreductase subunit C [Bdellovibrionales bacterium]